MPRSRTSRYSADYKLILKMLTEQRESSGITQADLCKKMGTSQSMLSKLERGVVRIDLMDLLSYLNGIGASPEKFIASYVRNMKKVQR